MTTLARVADKDKGMGMGMGTVGLKEGVIEAHLGGA